MARRYQLGQHWHGTRLSASMIDTYLDPQARTALDVGCDEGVMSALLTRRGLNTTGIEADENSLGTARALASYLGLDVAFENRILSLEDVKAMEEVDVTLLLSVHHQITANHGLDHADAFLKALGSKTRSQLFFQPAAIRRKYKQNVPFKDNDLTRISLYFLELLADVFPHSQVLGFSNNDIPRREPLRPMLLFSRNPIKINDASDPIGFIDELKRARLATHPIVQRLRGR